VPDTNDPGLEPAAVLVERAARRWARWLAEDERRPPTRAPISVRAATCGGITTSPGWSTAFSGVSLVQRSGGSPGKSKSLGLAGL